MSGNADWVIDADLHNLKISAASDGSGIAGSGSDSNPQRYPTLDQTNITASTLETYWNGGISAWAIDLVKHTNRVETLPYNGRITYNDGTNPQDLTNYDVFVFVEPNILFTATEKAAIINFVKNGGGLFIVSDHTIADRNNDGEDAVDVLNDLMTNSVANNPFGIKFNLDNLSGNYKYPDTSTNNPIIRGHAGTVTNFVYNAGASLTINTNQNPGVKGAIWTSNTHGANNVIVAYATYGAGKVVATGDSSPFDDGTGDSGDTLYFAEGYTDPSTCNGMLILNASLWLATPTAITPPTLKLTSTKVTNQIQFSWPTNIVNFSLQSSTNLADSKSWVTLPNQATISNNLATVTLPATNAFRYYRLAY